MELFPYLVSLDLGKMDIYRDKTLPKGAFPTHYIFFRGCWPRDILFLGLDKVRKNESCFECSLFVKITCIMLEVSRLRR